VIGSQYNWGVGVCGRSEFADWSLTSETLDEFLFVEIEETGTVALSARAKNLVAEFSHGNVKLGDLKKRGAEIRKDHDLAMELWSTGGYDPRLLATLIFDKKLLTENVIDQLAADMLQHEQKERTQLADWLLANQFAKDKKLASLMTTWEKNPSPILRRLFWYHQARLRWVGQVPPGNSADLLDTLTKDMAQAKPEVQWAMNFCACQIGVHEPEFRDRCIKLGETLGLYKDEHVAKNCTPSYIPEFIRIEVAKRE
jgi:3-methyladenine DNA glycosylase AlkD